MLFICCCLFLILAIRDLSRKASYYYDDVPRTGYKWYYFTINKTTLRYEIPYKRRERIHIDKVSGIDAEILVRIRKQIEFLYFYLCVNHISGQSWITISKHYTTVRELSQCRCLTKKHAIPMLLPTIQQCYSWFTTLSLECSIFPRDRANNHISYFALSWHISWDTVRSLKESWDGVIAWANEWSWVSFSLLISMTQLFLKYSAISGRCVSRFIDRNISILINQWLNTKNHNVCLICPL